VAPKSIIDGESAVVNPEIKLRSYYLKAEANPTELKT
jgi:hypothetical protein